MMTKDKPIPAKEYETRKTGPGDDPEDFTVVVKEEKKAAKKKAD